MAERRREWIALGLYLAVHPKKKSQIPTLSVLSSGSPGPVLRGLPEVPSLRPDRTGAIFSGTFPEWADKQIDECRKRGVTILTYEDAGYPQRLKLLPDPPPSIYVRGELPGDDMPALSVVGSRRPTHYGRRMAGDLSRDLAEAGGTVVSGLARGVDSAAHRGALAAGGRTVGILGCGLDVVYPRENGRLYDEVAASGAVVTEYPLGTPPQPYHFPIRNRLIAAMGEAVVVVEAAKDSGSLITAVLAAEMGVPVGALPGQVTSDLSAGCHQLIYDGAHLVRNAHDVAWLLPDSRRKLLRLRPGDRRPVPRDLEGPARRVLEALESGPKSADRLAAETSMTSGDVLGRLLDLEIRGLAEQHPGGLYSRKD